MKKSEGYFILPVNRDYFKKGMYVLPLRNGHKKHVFMLALIEGLKIVKREVLNFYFGIMLPQIVPKHVHIFAPVAPHKHKPLAEQILN